MLKEFPRTADDEVEAAAKKANAWEFISTFPDTMQTQVGDRGIQLSGGQKQRVAIARAMAAEPKVLLADEPTGALDTTTSYEVMDLIQKLNDDGNTILIVTHEPDIAEMCKRVVMLKDGVIIEDKKVEQVRASNYV